MHVSEMLGKLTVEDLLILKANALERLVSKEISLSQYLENESLLNAELEKYKELL